MIETSSVDFAQVHKLTHCRTPVALFYTGEPEVPKSYIEGTTTQLNSHCSQLFRSSGLRSLLNLEDLSRNFIRTFCNIMQQTSKIASKILAKILNSLSRQH